MSHTNMVKNKLKSSISVKLVVIGLLLLILQIPQLFVQALINERQSMHYEARNTITQRWGGSQHIGPPLLNTSHQVEQVVKGKKQIKMINSQILPASFSIDVDIDASTRYLGIYEVPVFIAQLTMNGVLELDPLKYLGSSKDWQIENIFIPIKSMRGLKSVSHLKVNGQDVEVAQQQNLINGQTGISLDLSQLKLDLNRSIIRLNYEIKLSVAGSEQFSVLPMAGQSEIKIHANWPSPSFNGDFLPAQRTINEDGFSANWQVNEMNHNLGRVIRDSFEQDEQASQRFSNYSASRNWPELGVEILIPADNYQVNERAVKYSLLIMVLTFAGFFLAEIFFKLRLHPFQYLLIGFSLTAFYLLLLSVSEYIYFDWAFAIAVLANIGLIGGYCSVILKQQQRGLLTALLFAVLYAFIFVLVKAEQSSLLMGAIGIWVFLALVMYLTRKIDWYEEV